MQKCILGDRLNIPCNIAVMYLCIYVIENKKTKLIQFFKIDLGVTYLSIMISKYFIWINMF